jgi:hypothetical protein
MLAGLASATTGGAAVAAAKPHAAVHSDVDGDGKPDLVVGSESGNRVLVDYTTAKPGGSHRQWINSPQRSTFDFGAALATGDFNGDGFADLAVGAPEYMTPDGVSEGAVYLYTGSKRGLHYSGKAFYGPSDSEATNDFGAALATGSVNGDRFTDLAVGDPGASPTDPGQGSAVVLEGSRAGLRPGSRVTLTSAHPLAGGGFGTAVALGDVNGDGRGDLIVGEPGGGTTLSGTATHVGDVQQFLSTKHGLSLSARTFSGSGLHAAGGLGSSLATGDINDDGFADVVAGAPQASVGGQGLAGVVAVLSGSRHGLAAAGAKVLSKLTAHVAGSPVSTDRFGLAVAVGDLNHDHHADVIVGVPGGTAAGAPAAGEVYVFHGAKHGVTAVGSQLITQDTAGVPGSPVSGSQFGSAVATLGTASALHRRLIIGMPDEHAGGWTFALVGDAHRVTGAGALVIKDSRESDQFGGALAL